MARTAKITAVPVDDQPDLALETAAEEEPTTDAEKTTDVLNEVNVTGTVLSIEDDAPEVHSELAAPEARARRVYKKRICFPRASIK